MNKIEERCVENLRYLSATTISNAKSGHTGISVGASAIFYALYANALKFSPVVPNYFNRDRFVMCAGHASALEYCTLHMFGYNYTMEDLKQFRKLGSVTKGHPSVNPKMGIDASGGPLGQGIPMAVGMAIAEKKLAHKFNKPGFNIIDHYTYCFAGDGSLMEGVTNEASSLAGTLQLNKLIVLYDSNNITIEGSTDLAFTEDVIARYKALGWNTIEVKNGNNTTDIFNAINQAKQQTTKPTLIKINTTIGFSTPLANNCKVHGTPLTVEQLQQTKQSLNINYSEFEVAKDVQEHLNKIINIKNQQVNNELNQLEQYKKQYPSEYDELQKWLQDYYSRNINWDAIKLSDEDQSTRQSNKSIINQIALQVPNLISGSADLAPSIGSNIGEENFSATNIGARNLCFGVREHAMGAICNGIMLHGGFRVMCSTFMVFSDYMRHAIRMSALMNVGVIYLLSHDSIAVGEDGATHQPVEYNAMYRATPNLNFIRPADDEEIVGAYKVAFNGFSPTILALTRQKLKNLTCTRNNILCGGYLAVKSQKPAITLVTCGSELQICLQASEMLKANKIGVNVVSVPCKNLFEAMPEKYRIEVLNGAGENRIAVEASNDDSWYKYVGLKGKVIGINSFGHTGTGEQLMQEFGFTAENLCKVIKDYLK